MHHISNDLLIYQIPVAAACCCGAGAEQDVKHWLLLQECCRFGQGPAGWEGVSGGFPLYLPVRRNTLGWSPAKGHVVCTRKVDLKMSVHTVPYCGREMSTFHLVSFKGRYLNLVHYLLLLQITSACYFFLALPWPVWICNFDSLFFFWPLF